MGQQAFIGFATAAAVLVLCMLAYRALARAAFPIRVSLFTLSTDLLHEKGVSQSDRRQVQHCMDNALKFSAGWMVLRAGFLALRDTIKREDSTAPGTARRRDPRVAKVYVAFVVSALAANPIALLVFIPMVVTVMIIERERAKAAVADTAAYLPCVHA